MPVDEPTLYELESKSSVTAWNTVRSSVLDVVTESCAMTIEQNASDVKERLFSDAYNVDHWGSFARVVFQNYIKILTFFTYQRGGRSVL